MFDQHPVPQQISSYQFRLVGDMTIKQFFQVAAGAIVALIIYSFPLPALLKWPLILVAALSGAAFAFLPIQDRPLEQWLFAFFRSIYSPTYFVWKKIDPAPQYFKVDTNIQPNANTNQQLTDAQQHAKDLKEGVDIEEESSFKPDFIAGSEQNDIIEAQQQAAQENVIQTNTQNNVQTQQIGTAPLVEGAQYQGQVLTDSSKVEAKQEEKRELSVPQQTVVEVEKKGVELVEQPAQQVYQATTTKPVEEVMQQQTQTIPTVQAQFSPDAAPPIPPELPNIIKGQVMDSAGHIVDGAILEIKDEAGRPVRAVRTNNAGHFQIVTSLPNGTYFITIEKQNLEFEPISVKAIGEIIQPIAIRSK